MCRKISLKLLCTVVGLCIVIGVIIGLISTQLIAWQQYQHTAQIVGALSRSQAQMQDTLMQILKDTDSASFAFGDALLQQYNYSPDTFWNRNAAIMIFTGIMLMFILVLLLSIVWLKQYKKQQTRINGLTAYLESVNLGQDSLLRQQEDNFSQLEDEISKTVTELRHSRENAIRERQSLANNLTDISHQLKTPVTSMSLMAQLLAESRTGDDFVYVDKLTRQINRLEELVSSLLTLSRLDAETIEFKMVPMNICDMLLRAAEPVEEVIQQRNQELIIQSDPDISFIGDIAWIAEAFLNLIKNCSEHTPDGGVIKVNYSQNPLYSEILVEDSGKGFDRDDMPHLFERFYKGKNAKKDSVGIGLALSKAIITSHNGTIQAENATSGGARFIVKFYT